MRERKGVDPDGKGRGKEVRGVEGVKTVTIYIM